MFSAEIYKTRRQELAKIIDNGNILIFGNNHSPRNYPANTYQFRQDSNFLYFAGIDLPGLVLLINPQTQTSTLYGNDNTVEDAIWTGQLPKLREWADKVGIENVEPISKLSDVINSSTLNHYLPPYPHDRKIWLSELLKKDIAAVQQGVSAELIKAVISLRSYKLPEEVAQIEDALNRATSKFHVEAMKMAQQGIYEYQIAGQIESTMLKNNCSSAYGIICSVRGEILHNESYHNQLQQDQLLLIDAGAENPMHYASDITRTTPVGGRFNQQQKEIYNIVLEALNKSIEAIQPGIQYRQIHLDAARIITSGLKEIGLMKGDVDEAVLAGAHTLFFPHGLGHMIGLDVHDMEDLGENYVGYNESITRSEQFGTAYLRLGRELESDFVITVEPGVYFIPELINKWQTDRKLEQFINYSKLDKYLTFGGIRIEDNIHVTKQGSVVLGNPIPKTVNEIENLY